MQALARGDALLSRRRIPRDFVSSAALSALDQAFSSLSNVAMVSLAARSGGASTLGEFALAMSAFVLTLSISRATISDPLLTSSQRGRATDLRPSVLLWLSAVPASCSAVVCLAVGVLRDQPSLIATACILPVLIAHDTMRFEAFARLEIGGALRLDAVWAILSLCSLATSVAWNPSGAQVVGVWGLGAMVALAYLWGDTFVEDVGVWLRQRR